MAVQKQQMQLFQYSGDKKTPFKLIISTELETKIRTFCALSPDREWSGVLFYLFEGSFEKGVTIYANDLFLMDQGSGAHTEFDLDAPEITRHLFMEGLVNHCMGLIHSHNQMRAFFSGEDSDTLVTHGSHMHNFVSLVVNNDGNYVARLTRQVKFDGTEEKVLRGTSTSPLFNTDEVETYTYNHRESSQIKKEYLEYIDLEIVKEEPSLPAIHSAIERFGEINSKCSYQRPATREASPFNSVGSYPIAHPPKIDWKEARQGTLFDDSDDGPFKDDQLVITKDILAELKTIPWKRLGFDSWVSQLLYGSPFEKSTIIDKATVARLNVMYKERFPNEVEFGAWFDFWIDYMVSDFSIPMSKQSMFMDSEEAVIYKTYIFISGRGLIYEDAMLHSLLNRLV